MNNFFHFFHQNEKTEKKPKKRDQKKFYILKTQNLARVSKLSNIFLIFEKWKMKIFQKSVFETQKKSQNFWQNEKFQPKKTWKKTKIYRLNELKNQKILKTSFFPKIVNFDPKKKYTLQKSDFQKKVFKKKVNFEFLKQTKLNRNFSKWKNRKKPKKKWKKSETVLKKTKKNALFQKNSLLNKNQLISVNFFDSKTTKKSEKKWPKKSKKTKKKKGPIFAWKFFYFQNRCAKWPKKSEWLAGNGVFLRFWKTKKMTKISLLKKVIKNLLTFSIPKWQNEFSKKGPKKGVKKTIKKVLIFRFFWHAAAKRRFFEKIKIDLACTPHERYFHVIFGWSEGSETIDLGPHFDHILTHIWPMFWPLINH